MNTVPPRIRLFVGPALRQGENVVLDRVQAHYLLTVLRAKVGTAVALFNGQDGEWRAEVVEATKRHVLLAVGRQLRIQDEAPDLWLVFAPVKRMRIDLIVEKATELGVAALLPVFTRFTAMSRINLQRLAAIAVEAAEQSGRLTVPPIRPPEDLSAVLAGWPAGRRLLVLDESGGGRPIADALTGLTVGPTALLVGPEGGFANSELDALRALSFSTPVGLGPRILRAETAVIAALACFQAIAGDWRCSAARRNCFPSTEGFPV
jgi:16S rRNA (uracil1498-N3)-methyltransferase